MPKRKQVYIVVTAENLELLEEWVNEKLSEGWKLQGGPSQGANEYLQAMVK